jgi:hypothetical protein
LGVYPKGSLAQMPTTGNISKVGVFKCTLQMAGDGSCWTILEETQQ